MTNDPLPLGAILLDPKHNISRSCVIDPPEHPDVVRLIQTLRVSGSTLMHCVGLRPEAPIVRPCGRGPCCAPAAMKRDGALAPAHLYSLHYGFRRWVGLATTGRTHLVPANNEIKWLVDEHGEPWTLERCGEANIIENTARGNSTEFDMAMAVTQKFRQGTSIERLADQAGIPPVDVAGRIMIIERCPLALKAAWARRPTQAVTRALLKIAAIDPHERWPLEKRHAAMLEMWTAFEQEVLEPKAAQRAERAAAAAAAAPTPPIRPAPEWVGRRKPAHERARVKAAPPQVVGAAVATLRRTVDTASEVCDPTAGWRPLTAAERAFAQMLLAALARGDGAAVLR